MAFMGEDDPVREVLLCCAERRAPVSRQTRFGPRAERSAPPAGAAPARGLPSRLAAWAKAVVVNARQTGDVVGGGWVSRGVGGRAGGGGGGPYQEPKENTYFRGNLLPILVRPPPASILTCSPKAWCPSRSFAPFLQTVTRKSSSF